MFKIRTLLRGAVRATVRILHAHILEFVCVCVCVCV